MHGRLLFSLHKLLIGGCGAGDPPISDMGQSREENESVTHILYKERLSAHQHILLTVISCCLLLFQMMPLDIGIHIHSDQICDIHTYVHTYRYTHAYIDTNIN